MGVELENSLKKIKPELEFMLKKYIEKNKMKNVEYLNELLKEV
jgi:hypothetical protein